MKRKHNALLASIALNYLAAPVHAGDYDHDRGYRSIKHVFVIVLENEGYDVTFGPSSKAPYLSQTLASQGALLRQYFGTTHVSLGNYVAMMSGQAVNASREEGGRSITTTLSAFAPPSGDLALAPIVSRR